MESKPNLKNIEIYRSFSSSEFFSFCSLLSGVLNIYLQLLPGINKIGHLPNTLLSSIAKDTQPISQYFRNSFSVNWQVRYSGSFNKCALCARPEIRHMDRICWTLTSCLFECVQLIREIWVHDLETQT